MAITYKKDHVMKVKAGDQQIATYIYKQVDNTDEDDPNSHYYDDNCTYFAVIPSNEAKKAPHVFPAFEEDEIDLNAEYLPLEAFDSLGCVLQGDTMEDIQENLHLWISLSED